MTHGADRMTAIHHSQGIQVGDGNTQYVTFPGRWRLRVLVSYTDEIDRGPAPTYLDAVRNAIQDVELSFCDASNFTTPAEHDGYDVYVNLVGLLYGPELHDGCSQPEVAFDAALRSGKPHLAYLIDNVHLENGRRKLAELARQEKFQTKVEASRTSLFEVAGPQQLRRRLHQDLASLIESSPPSFRSPPSGQLDGDRQVEPVVPGVPGGEKKSFDWVTVAIAVVLGLVFYAVALWAVDAGSARSLGAGVVVAVVTATAVLAFQRLTKPSLSD
ncbi:hypothetical protein ACIBJE_17365 [Micromonospora sp. NPDC050187]|uniref:hypothetical protein n=1 Tax=Micromonospora sp. NPDC050187 TaxID=3364277 RepID=UPI0037B928BA